MKPNHVHIAVIIRTLRAVRAGWLKLSTYHIYHAPRHQPRILH
jgi:hypothetical protein